MSADPTPIAAQTRNASAAPSRNVLIWISISVATIAVVGGLGLLLRRSGLLAAEAPEEHVSVTADDQYLVLLSQIEVENLTPRGHRWDLTDGGPDIRYDVYWRGDRIFQSSTREDTLLARWDPSEVGIGDLIHGVSAESALKAARITVQRGEKLEFRVVDTDVVANDEIGRWEVPVESLQTGDQTWNQPAPGIRQAVCHVVRVGHSGR
jgi:hypothetical protein